MAQKWGVMNLPAGAGKRIKNVVSCTNNLTMKVFNSHKNVIFTKLTLKATLRGHTICGIGRIYKIIRSNRNVEAPSRKKVFQSLSYKNLVYTAEAMVSSSGFGIVHWNKVKFG